MKDTKFWCGDCGTLINEGEAKTFGICDDCWAKHHQKMKYNGAMSYTEGSEPIKLTDNEIIAEFMGLIRKEANETYNKAQYWIPVEDKRYKGKFVGYYDTLQYHEFWDWLMPVVKKITNTKPMNQAWYDVKYNLIEGDINLVYKRVVSFIKWFESLKSDSK